MEPSTASILQGQRWVPGTIAEVTEPVSFLVKLVRGQLVQIRICNDHGELQIPQEEEEGIQMDMAPTEPHTRLGLKHGQRC